MRKLLKKYPAAFSGAAAVMRRATTPRSFSGQVGGLKCGWMNSLMSTFELDEGENMSSLSVNLGYGLPEVA